MASSGVGNLPTWSSACRLYWTCQVIVSHNGGKRRMPARSYFYSRSACRPIIRCSFRGLSSLSSTRLSVSSIEALRGRGRVRQFGK